jgi:hypothetical protein
MSHRPRTSIDAAMSDALERAAEQAGTSRAAILREALGVELRARGVWPPCDRQESPIVRPAQG